jgi:hypothetical protein
MISLMMRQIREISRAAAIEIDHHQNRFAFGERSIPLRTAIQSNQSLERTLSVANSAMRGPSYASLSSSR